MNRSRLVLLLLAPALIAAAILLLLAEKPRAVSAQPSAPEPEMAPQTSPAKPIAQAKPSPSVQAPAQPPVLPPGTTVATPGGRDPNTTSIPAAPPGERVYRDHRNEVGYVPPPKKITNEGMNAANAAIRPAIASCLSSASTLQFTMIMSKGRAQIQEPKLMDADRRPEDQACIAKALGGLSWNTPDQDGTTQVTMPLR